VTYLAYITVAHGAGALSLRVPMMDIPCHVLSINYLLKRFWTAKRTSEP